MTQYHLYLHEQHCLRALAQGFTPLSLSTWMLYASH